MPAAIDVETATRASGSICAIGVALTEGRRVCSRHWLIRPSRNQYEPFNSRIHGISADDTRDAPTFAEVWPAVMRFLSGFEYVVAHNAAATERRHLEAALAASRLRLPRWQLACTLAASRAMLPRRTSHTLADLADHYEIELDHHNAESDALACAHLATKLGLGGSLADYAIEWR